MKIILFDSADTGNVCAVCGRRIEPHGPVRVIGRCDPVLPPPLRHPSLVTVHPECELPPFHR